MTEQGVVTVLVKSRGMQYVLIAIAVVLVIKFLRRDIVDAKCAVKHGAEDLTKKVTNSELYKFSGNALKAANQLALHKHLPPGTKRKKSEHTKLIDSMVDEDFEFEKA